MLKQFIYFIKIHDYDYEQIHIIFAVQILISQGKKSERIDDSCKLASILDMFPDKSYREVQKKFAETGSVEDTVSAFLGFLL